MITHKRNKTSNVFVEVRKTTKYSIDPTPLMTCILTPKDLLTLANIITTSELPHHCPPCLGVFTSVQVTMLYLQENTQQQTTTVQKRMSK